MPDPLRLAIAGGGTGGHVSPALAVVAALRDHLAADGRTLTLLWLGSEGGVEQSAALAANIPFAAIPTGKLHRYLTPRTISDMARVPLGIVRARQHLARFRPHVVLSTGGFVSVPAVVAARWLGRPTLTHEQTVTVGLANRINARFADCIALSYAASRAWLPSHPALEPAAATATLARRNGRAPLVVTGNPVRPELFRGDPARARAAFGLCADLPVVYITGGARGSHVINTAVEEALLDLLPHCQVVHQTGPAAANGDLPRLEQLADGLPVPLRERYVPRASIGRELADLYALASLVVGRAGAGTLAELAALGLPSVLIPLPGASADEQTRNARLLADAGAALLLPEAELTPPRLTAEVTRLVAAPDQLALMGAAARQFARPEAAHDLVHVLLALASRTA